MYSADLKYIESESALQDLLCRSCKGGSKVAILGGHFMLFYDKKTDELIPAIPEELDIEEHKKFAEQYAGDFPFISFQYATELHSCLDKRNIKSEIILLVNDHKFQSKNFQTDVEISSLSGRGGDLRKKYYNKNKTPRVYKNLLKKKGLDYKSILSLNQNKKRTKNDLLPKESWFYSEQKLRRRFDKYVLNRLLKEKKVHQIETIEGKEIFYLNPTRGVEICLTENGSCACTAEVIELITILQKKAINEIIMFIPSECNDAVDNGIEAVLNINNIKTTVTSVSGFGTASFLKNKLPFIVKQHIFE